MFKVILGFLLATTLWGFSFLGPFNFWIKIFLSATILLAFALSDGNTRKIFRPRLEDIPVGVISGTLLFIAFFAIARFLNAYSPELYRFVQDVKDLKNLAPITLVFSISMFVGICEEVFWRGFVQRVLIEKLGKLQGYILALILYSLAHASTLNSALIFAALGAGIVWGFLFLWKRDLSPLIISHATWDIMLLIFGM